MRVLIIDLLDLWVTVPDYFDMDHYLMFTMIILRLWIDGSVTDIALVQMDEIWLILDETIYWPVSGLVNVLFMLLKVTGKVSLDCNDRYSSIRYSSIHHIHGYCYCLLFFHYSQYTRLLLLYCYYYCHCIISVIEIVIISVIEITWILIALNNNINGQITLGLGKLIEETSVFWVDLEYRLHSRDMFHYRVPADDWHLICLLFHNVTMSIVPQWYCETVTDYLAVGPGSASGIWAVVPGMYGTHLKYGQCLQPISFKSLGPRLTRVVGVVWDASITSGNECSLT